VVLLLGNRRCYGNQFVLYLLGVVLVLPPGMNFIRPQLFAITQNSELLQFLTEYVTWRHLDLWSLDLGVMSRVATLVVNTCAKLEVVTVRELWWL